ncbi:hypothetical protein [Lactobacillus ultunensis]|uniref:Temperature-sensitive replication protein n=1 Tax=Lactobacillus ultunensis DSM 16047 TaxID=525365 RepID=C2EK87_9LACO|nr:hypothetical protein [Lactobacillus ultunensis]EEJ73102.1 hypothetical protein HMPREF0548_0083 [Lactobacillus ultunensis DSM 16047]
MSSYYELIWREDELDSYSTDKLNFIFNTINHPYPVRYRQMYSNRLEWQKAVNHHEATIKKVKDIITQRDDAHDIRESWLKQHKQKATDTKNGYTVEQLANKLPHMANQLGAFMEIENIEIKYFDEDFKPRYDLSDFKDIFKENYSSSGFKQDGITESAFLNLYPNIKKKDLDKILALADYEPEIEDNTEIMPYWYAVNAKRMLIDGDSFTETFDV